MTRIGDATQLAAMIRRQVDALRAPEPAARRVLPGGAPTPGAGSGAATASGDAGPREALSQPLAAWVAGRVQAIDPADPARARKAFRIFLESVLLDGLGAAGASGALGEDPAFAELVDDVQRQMEADPALAAQIAQAGEWLLAQRQGPD